MVIDFQRSRKSAKRKNLKDRNRDVHFMVGDNILSISNVDEFYVSCAARTEQKQKLNTAFQNNTTASKDPLLCTLIIHCFPYPSYRSETASLTNHHRAVCLDLDKARRCVCNSGTVDKSGTVRGLTRFVVEPKMHGEKSFKSFGKFGKRGRRNKGGRFHHSGSKTMEVMQTYE